MNISGGDIVFSVLIVCYFAYEIYRMRCIKEVARMAAESERRQAPSDTREGRE